MKAFRRWCETRTGELFMDTPALHAWSIGFEPLPFDHPLLSLRSSGTTGVPKCIVHRAGGVLFQHLKERALRSDIGPGEREPAPCAGTHPAGRGHSAHQVRQARGAGRARGAARAPGGTTEALELFRGHQELET